MAVQPLRRSSEISAVFAARAAAHGSLLSVHCRRRERPASPDATRPNESRATVIGGRELGSAVQRNRAKRRVRAALQDAVVPEGFDLVVRPRPPARDAAFADVRAELDRLIARAAARSASGSPRRHEARA